MIPGRALFIESIPHETIPTNLLLLRRVHEIFQDAHIPLDLRNLCWLRKLALDRLIAALVAGYRRSKLWGYPRASSSNTRTFSTTCCSCNCRPLSLPAVDSLLSRGSPQWYLSCMSSFKGPSQAPFYSDCSLGQLLQNHHRTRLHLRIQLLLTSHILLLKARTSPHRGGILPPLDVGHALLDLLLGHVLHPPHLKGLDVQGVLLPNDVDIHSSLHNSRFSFRLRECGANSVSIHAPCAPTSSPSDRLRAAGTPTP